MVKEGDAMPPPPPVLNTKQALSLAPNWLLSLPVTMNKLFVEDKSKERMICHAEWIYQCTLVLVFLVIKTKLVQRTCHKRTPRKNDLKTFLVITRTSVDIWRVN